MSSLPMTFADDVIYEPARVQFEVFLDEHRAQLNGCLDGLSEEQVRRSLVPSRTTLLGLVKHATFVEKVWCDEAVTCRSRAEIGIPATPDESYIIDDDTPSRPSSEPIAKHANHHGARPRRSPWTTRSTATGAARYRCAGCTSTCLRARPALRTRRHTARAADQRIARAGRSVRLPAGGSMLAGIGQPVWSSFRLRDDVGALLLRPTTRSLGR